MLAVLRFGLGMRIVIACSTRGEGGQNAMGPERGGLLGLVRTRELEEAARELEADLAWLGFGPDDPVHDFGFSKNGEDTLARWGRERILERLVRAYRRERPDIVIPTFLDVPGQHGHHRAMTAAAEAAIALAADPAAFPEHLAEGLMPWRVGKYYLPAWSGGGGTYDDEVPPPNTSVAVTATERDSATGASYGEIGEWSRAHHATQGMGRWSATPKDSWPLHLKLGPAGEETDIRANLPATMGELGRALGGTAGEALGEAQQAIERAIAAFPDRAGIVAALVEAGRHVANADGALPTAEADRHGHRLARKQSEIDAALLLAAGVAATAWVEPPDIVPGGIATLVVHTVAPAGISTAVVPKLPAYIAAGGPETAGGLTRIPLMVAPDAPLSAAFAETFSSLGANGLVGVTVAVRVAGREARAEVALEEPVQIVPAQSVAVEPQALVLPLAQLPLTREIAVRREGAAAAVSSEAPAGIRLLETSGGFRLEAGRALAAGRYRLPLKQGNGPAFRIDRIAYPDLGRMRYPVPQALDILALDLALPEGAKVGYAGGGADHVGVWMKRMGLDVTELDAEALRGDLGAHTSIVVGIFAFGLRPDLRAAATKLREWVERGGHLLTLYHRPGDGWDPDGTPPRRLVIGSPSLRWRVTDPNAAVDVLEPGHPLLVRPNLIGPADWAGWDKERGLYFAAEWDPAYRPLLAMHDHNEAPLNGSLLSARIGQGRHTHVSLVLHHQLDKLIPGAFRLLANLLQRAA
jgi:LmbE family N-acetylglucosaminyl deacetylase